jgi:7-cyano-7-deazaguanine synthase
MGKGLGMAKRGVVLLSGGLDSVTVLAMARSRGFEVVALSFTYGQRHDLELDAARAQAEIWGVCEHLIMTLDLRPIGGSALTTEMEVPKGRDVARVSEAGVEGEAEVGGVPVTYVPARNAIFLSCAVAAAEARGIQDVFIGVNAVDFSGYPDCRPEFIQAFEEMARLGTKAGSEGMPFHVHAPLIEMTKGEIIRRGLELGVDYGRTWTCYDPTPAGDPCGGCDGCLLRAKGFREAGAADPLL